MSNSEKCYITEKNKITYIIPTGISLNYQFDEFESIIKKIGNIKDIEKRYERYVIYKFLKIGEKLRGKSFLQLLHYDLNNEKSGLSKKEKEDIEDEIKKFVDKFGELGILSKCRPSAGFVTQTISGDMEEFLANFSYSLLDFDFITGSPNIESSILFEIQTERYNVKTRKIKKGNRIRTATSYFPEYYFPESYANIKSLDDLKKEAMPLVGRVMKTDDYFKLFFPMEDTDNETNGTPSTHKIYCEPVALFLIAAKGFYLVAMYLLQLLRQNYRGKNEDEKKPYENLDGKKKEAYEYLLSVVQENCNHTIGFSPLNLMFKALFDDIEKNNDFILICPWCGSVSIEQNIPRGKIFCEGINLGNAKMTCQEYAKRFRNRLLNNAAEPIKDELGIIFRLARYDDMEKLSTLHECLYEKYDKSDNFDGKMIKRLKNLPCYVRIYVAEYQDKIIAYSVGLLDYRIGIPGFSIHSDPDYYYTNVKRLLPKYIGGQRLLELS